MERKWLCPAKGLKVRDPQGGGHLPAEGREVAMSSYWVRRLAEKSVVEGKAPSVPAAPSVEESPKKRSKEEK